MSYIKTVQATINGTTYSLELNEETQLYEAEISAPTTSSFGLNSGNYYPVTIKVVDSAGNSTTITSANETFGENLRLRVKETTAPTISITSPSSNSYTNRESVDITFKVTDSGSGFDGVNFKVYLDGSLLTGLSKTTVTNGYSFSKTVYGLSEGKHSISITAYDNDGNGRSVSRYFYVDVTAPSIEITYPPENFYTNEETCSVKGKVTEATSGISSLTLKTHSGVINIEHDADGSFVQNITLIEGADTLVITAVDQAGNTTIETRVVTLISEPPNIESVTIEPNPVNCGKIFKVTVKVS